MSDWLFCPKCGMKLDQGDSTCRKCGAAVPDAVPVEGDRVAEEDSAEVAALTDELRQALAPDLQLVRLLEKGGMGMVFVARDPALRRDVVVKVLLPRLAHDSNARRRFEREAEAAAAVSHANVVSVYRVGDLPISGTSYFVMQYVDGETLSEAYPEGTALQETRVRRIVGEVASALAAAHARGLVHRDIKPSNIMLEGETSRAIVLDFGISAAVSSTSRPEETKLTAQGTSIGTPQYMSPEQAAGDEITDRSDVYSLGLVAFELVTGRAAFKANNPMALIAAHLKDTPPSVRELRPDLDPHFGELVDRCIDKEPSARPAAEDLARALLPATTSIVEWPPPGLEPIRGRVHKYLQGALSFAAVETAYAFALGMTVALGGSDAAIGLGFFGGVGVVIYAGIMGRGARHLPRAVRDARRAGYPHRVVWDVAIDDQPDTEQLVNRVGPFASLTAIEAQRLMRWRRVGVVAVGLAVLLTMFAPAVALLGNEPDYMLLQALGLIVSGALWWGFQRPERRYRRRYLRREARGKRVNVSPDVAAVWVEAAGMPPEGGHTRVALARVFASTLNVAIAVVLFLGIAWFGNTVGIVTEFEDDPPGDPTTHAVRLFEARDAAMRPFPSLGLGAAAVPVGDEEAWAVLLHDTTRQSVDSLAGRVEALLSGMRYTELDASVIAELREVAAYEPRQAWRSLARPELPALWYRDAMVWERAQSDSADANSSRPLAPEVACACNAPLREVWKFVSLQLAEAILNLADGKPDEAVVRASEAIQVGHNLVRDPTTVEAGVDVLNRSVRFLEEAGVRRGLEWLSDDAAVLAGYVDDLTVARLIYDAKPAVKAMARPSRRSVRDSVLVLLADTAIQPVHRWGLVRAAVLGACYNEDELFFGIDGERRQLVDRAVELAADLPHSDEYGEFFRALDWESGHLTGWRAWLGKLLWVLPHVSHCNRLGLLEVDASEVN